MADALPSLLPALPILAKCLASRSRLQRVPHGRSETKSIAIAPQYAPLAS
jgi:hypothetical protein